MKNHILSFVITGLLLVSAGCSKDESYENRVKRLPEAAQSLIANYFPGNRIESVKELPEAEKETYLKYKVKLSGGIYIDFSEGGNLLKIESDDALPESFLTSTEFFPTRTADIKNLSPGNPVIEIEINYPLYIFRLKNGAELFLTRYWEYIFAHSLNSTEELPEKTQTFLRTYFEDMTPELILKTIEPSKMEYQVILKNWRGMRLNLLFDRGGNWYHLERLESWIELPKALLKEVPRPVSEYMLLNHPNSGLLSMTKYEAYYAFGINTDETIVVDPQGKSLSPNARIIAFAREHYISTDDIQMTIRPSRSPEEVIYYCSIMDSGFALHMVTDPSGDWSMLTSRIYEPQTVSNIPWSIIETLPSGIVEYISTYYAGAHFTYLWKYNDRIEIALGLPDAAILVFDRSGNFLERK